MTDSSDKLPNDHPLSLFWQSVPVVSGKSLESLLASHVNSEGYLDLLTVDLSLGGLEPHALAKELTHQLGIEFEFISVDCEKGPSAEDIDRQAYGNMGQLIAYKNAKQIVRVLRENPHMQVLIALPDAKCRWEEEDLCLINEISFLFDYQSHWLICAVTTGEISMPDPFSIKWIRSTDDKLSSGHPDCALNYFPGLILNASPEIRDGISTLTETNACWTLKDGRYFISAGRHYSSDLLTSSLSDQEIEVINGINPWFRFCLSPERKEIKSVPGICRRLAEIAFNLGCEGYALRIANWIGRHNWGPAIKSKYQMTLMYIYLHSDRYELSSTLLDEMPQHLTKKEQEIIWNRKGYAYVFLDKPTDALKCFDYADSISNRDGSQVEYGSLFRKNIKSLALLKNNDIENAFKLQKELERDVRKIEQDCFHFTSINTLNIGRLYRQMGAQNKWLSYVLKFTKMNEGVSSDSYLNIQHHYLSDIYESIGQPKKAFWEMVKLALTWLSADSLGDLSKRRIKKITRMENGSDFQIIEKISEIIINDLKRISAKLGYDLKAVHGSFPDFIRTKGLLKNNLRRKKHYLIHTQNLSVLGAGYLIKKRMQGGPIFESLHRIVWQIIKEKTTVIQGKKIYTILISMDPFYSIGCHFHEVIGETPFFNIDSILHRSQLIGLDKKMKSTCEDMLWIKLSDAIDTIIDHQTDIELRFKRFRSNKLINGDEANLIRHIANSMEGIKLSDLSINQKQLTNLYSKNLVRIYSNKKCKLNSVI